MSNVIVKENETLDSEGTSQNISSLDLTIKKDDTSEMYRIF